MSRPEKPIDWELVDKLLLAGCNGTQICPYFNMHYNTFYNRFQDHHGIGFSDYQCIKRSQGDSMLLTAQFDKAVSGDNTMLVWLGKNRLEQKETPTTITVDKETVQSFKAAMEQISQAQEARKMEYTNLRNACKSDSVENEILT